MIIKKLNGSLICLWMCLLIPFTAKSEEWPVDIYVYSGVVIIDGDEVFRSFQCNDADDGYWGLYGRRGIDSGLIKNEELIRGSFACKESDLAGQVNSYAGGIQSAYILKDTQKANPNYVLLRVKTLEKLKRLEERIEALE